MVYHTANTHGTSNAGLSSDKSPLKGPSPLTSKLSRQAPRPKKQGKDTHKARRRHSQVCQGHTVALAQSPPPCWLCLALFEHHSTRPSRRCTSKQRCGRLALTFFLSSLPTNNSNRYDISPRQQLKNRTYIYVDG